VMLIDFPFEFLLEREKLALFKGRIVENVVCCTVCTRKKTNIPLL